MDNALTPQPTGSDPFPLDDPGLPPPIAEADSGLLAPWLPNSLSDSRYGRRDGWTPPRRAAFLAELSETGVVLEAVRAVGMSAQTAYALRARDPLFAAGWDAALRLARQRLADELLARALKGTVEQIVDADGGIRGERHRYDNRLSVAVLTRLDRVHAAAEERGEVHVRAAAHWADYLQALGDGREDAAADILTPLPPAPPAPPPETAPHHQVHQLSLNEEGTGPADDDDDRHRIWQEDDGGWWTDYPPPVDFDGDEEGGEWGDFDYRRTLSQAELALLIESGDIEPPGAERARAEEQRDRFFASVAADIGRAEGRAAKDALPPPTAGGSGPAEPEREEEGREGAVEPPAALAPPGPGRVAQGAQLAGDGMAGQVGLDLVEALDAERLADGGDIGMLARTGEGERPFERGGDVGHEAR